MNSEARAAEIALLRKLAVMAEFDGRPDLATTFRRQAEALEG
jgi:hypothetical protein